MSKLTDLCRKLVQFPCLSGQANEALDFMCDYFRQNGFTARLIDFPNDDGRLIRTLCATYGVGHPHFLFAGHIDVVPANPDEWRFPPFAAEIDDGIVYGRGIADMKGGLTCFAQACTDFVKVADFKGKITVIVSSDEEEPLVEGTRKILQMLHQEGEIFDFALVGEPSNPLTMGDEIKVGRRGDIVLHIISYGQGGHTAYSVPEDNPAHNLVNLLYRMQNDILDNGNAFFAPSTMQIATIDIGNRATNVVPMQAQATVDIRFNSEHTYASIEDWVQKHICLTDGKFDFTAEYIGESFLSPIDDNIINLQKIIMAHTGKMPKFSTAGGTSDARFVKDYCPVVEYGLTNATIHKTDECESVQNIETLYAVYSDFLKIFFK